MIAHQVSWTSFMVFYFAKLTSNARCRPHVHFDSGFLGQLIAALHLERAIDGAQYGIPVIREGC